MKTIIALSVFAAAATAVEFPVVQDMEWGTEAYSSGGEVGIGIDFAADVAVGNEWPWYADNNYMANSMNPYGKAYASVGFFIDLLFLKFDIEAEFKIVEAAINMMTKWEMPTFGNFCYGIDWDAAVAGFEVTIGVDIDECAWGLLGTLLSPVEVHHLWWEDQDFECEWRGGSIYYPMYEIVVDEKYEWGGELIEPACIANQNPYNY